MSAFMILLKKEWLESIRKHRLLVLMAVLGLFGIMSPLTAKYLPEIIKAMLGSTDELTKLGLILPPPTINDSYIQYYKNLTQMGIFVQILVFMNLVSDEIVKGTAVLMLTKSVSRTVFMLSKFTMACLIFMASLSISFIAFCGYTYYLFDKLDIKASIFGLLMYALLSFFILAFTFFTSTISRSTAISALAAIGGFFGISIISAIPKISDYFPMKLADAALQISYAGARFGDFTKSIILTGAAAVILILISLLSFKYKEL